MGRAIVSMWRDQPLRGIWTSPGTSKVLFHTCSRSLVPLLDMNATEPRSVAAKWRWAALKLPCHAPIRMRC